MESNRRLYYQMWVQCSNLLANDLDQDAYEPLKEIITDGMASLRMMADQPSSKFMAIMQN